MEKNKVSAVVYVKPGSSSAEINATLEIVLPAVDKMDLVYAKSTIDDNTLNSPLLKDPRVVKHPDKTPAELLNAINNKKLDLLEDYYDVVFYVIAGFPIKAEGLSEMVATSRKSAMLQIFRDHPGKPEDINTGTEWLQSQEWWQEPQSGLNTNIFVKEGFFCVRSKFIADVTLPSDIKFIGLEATLVTGAAKAKSANIRPLSYSLLDLTKVVMPPKVPPPPPPPPPPAPVAQVTSVPVAPQGKPADFAKLWQIPDEFAKVYPELAPRYKELKTRLDAPGCAQCVRNSLTHQLLQEVDKASVTPRDYTPFKAFPELIDLLRKRAPSSSLAYSQKGPRPTCLNCVRKHIGQAVVLMGESLQGYPAHRWLAVGHLGEAGEECVERYPKLAEEIRTVRNKTTDDLTFIPNLMDLFDKIDVLEKTPA